ncbi:MAG: ATP-dependent zinc protease [Nostoc sp. TH1S01]|nr:ATP-dependent zinc protease [Nostoc sp. TH1S01]
MRSNFRLYKIYTARRIFVAVFIGLFFGGGCSLQQTQATSADEQEIQTVGWVEKIKIPGVEKEVKAKLDTGATTTSIDAEILEQPKKDSESGGMIKFRFQGRKDNTEIFERPIVRWVQIKSREGADIRRPVVRMKFCVAGRWVEEEVNLADREDFNYPVLIGRNMLKQSKLAVDSSRTFTTESSCQNQEAQQ